MAEKPPVHHRFLLVEDDPDTAALVVETLEDHFGPGSVEHRATVAQAVTADLADVDLVLSDMNLPDGSGLQVLQKLLERRPDIPIVFVTAEGILDNALRAIRMGAYDYIVKAGDYLFAIPIVVEKNLAIWKTKQENQRLQKELELMATTDPLTGLSNRRAFTHALERSFAEKQRYNQDLACLMIDLDNFKSLNDTLGHQAGDRLLQQTAKVLEANCRQTDVAGRYGGDEFIVLLPMIDERTAIGVATRILTEFRTVCCSLREQRPDSPDMGMSMGMACVSHGRPSTPEQLVNQADHALYRAKQSGKNQLAIYGPAGSRTHAQILAQP